MSRNWELVKLGLLLALVGGLMLTIADLSATPRTETQGGDVEVRNTGCLDWWCRGEDVIFAALGTMLLAAAIAAFVWGIPRRDRR